MQRRFLPLLLSLALLLPLLPSALAAEEQVDVLAQTVYVTSPGREVTFDSGDFQLLCQRQTGQKLDFVTFSALSSRTGTLTLRFDKEDKEPITSATEVPAKYLSQVVFDPAAGFTGEARLSFTMTGTKDGTATGTLILSVPTPADLVLDPEETDPFDPELFNDLCKEAAKANLRSLTFSYPTAGTLTYQDGERTIPATDRMVFTMDPEEGYDLSQVSFTCSSHIPYAYLSISGTSVRDKEFSATIRIDLDPFVQGTRTCYALAGEPFPLGEALAAYAPVTLTLPTSREGTLWLDYGSDKRARKVLPGEVLTSENIDGLSFVPAGDQPRLVQLEYYSGPSGKDQRFGVLALVSKEAADAAPGRVTTTSTPVRLDPTLHAACAAREMGHLDAVTFPELPDPEQGAVTWHGGPVEAGQSYPNDGLAFVPGPAFRGGVTFSYTAVDSAGISFSGTVTADLGYPSNTRFRDMTGWEWALPSAEALGTLNAVPSTGDYAAFRPGDNATRMEVLYALTTLGYPGQSADGSTPFSDLPQDRDYANAAAVAYAHGIVQGDGAGHLNPGDPITRQDVLVMLHRALLDKGNTLTAADLSRFADGDELAPYARDAAAQLVGAGILQGSDQNRLEPTAPITRAEMAVLLCRAFPQATRYL